MSALADLLGSLVVSDQLLAQGEDIQPNHTIARLRSALGQRLDDEAKVACDHAVDNPNCEHYS